MRLRARACRHVPMAGVSIHRSRLAGANAAREATLTGSRVTEEHHRHDGCYSCDDEEQPAPFTNGAPAKRWSPGRNGITAWGRLPGSGELCVLPAEEGARARRTPTCLEILPIEH